jgi:hypothetical protein
MLEDYDDAGRAVRRWFATMAEPGARHWAHLLSEVRRRIGDGGSPSIRSSPQDVTYSAEAQLHRQSAVRITRLDRLINSLAVGVALGVTKYLGDGLAAGVLIGVLAFVVSFAVFRAVSGSE